MSNFLSFLSTAQVEAPEVSAVKSGRGVAKQWNPNPLTLAIRVWADGSVFPSKALIDKFDLEYRNATISKTPIPLKEGEEESEQQFKKEVYFVAGAGNGLDVIDSRVWPGYKAAQHMLFVSPVEKTEKKVDLFAQVTRLEDGTPKVKVEDQGAKTYGTETLIPAIKELYGISLSKDPGDVEFVDMIVFEEADGVNITEKLSQNIALFPKVVSRGEGKGKADYVRREGAKIYGFVPAELLYPQTKDNSEPADAPEVEEEETDEENEA